MYKSWDDPLSDQKQARLHRVNMGTPEQKFKEEMFRIHEQGKGMLLPKAAYYALLDEVKEAAITPKTGSGEIFIY